MYTYTGQAVNWWHHHLSIYSAIARCTSNILQLSANKVTVNWLSSHEYEQNIQPTCLVLQSCGSDFFVYCCWCNLGSGEHIKYRIKSWLWFILLRKLTDVASSHHLLKTNQKLLLDATKNTVGIYMGQFYTWATKLHRNALHYCHIILAQIRDCMNL